MPPSTAKTLGPIPPYDCITSAMGLLLSASDPACCACCTVSGDFVHCSRAFAPFSGHRAGYSPALHIPSLSRFRLHFPSATTTFATLAHLRGSCSHVPLLRFLVFFYCYSALAAAKTNAACRELDAGTFITLLLAFIHITRDLGFCRVAVAVFCRSAYIARWVCYRHAGTLTRIWNLCVLLFVVSCVLSRIFSLVLWFVATDCLGSLGFISLVQTNHCTQDLLISAIDIDTIAFSLFFCLLWTHLATCTATTLHSPLCTIKRFHFVTASSNLFTYVSFLFLIKVHFCTACCTRALNKHPGSFHSRIFFHFAIHCTGYNVVLPSLWIFWIFLFLDLFVPLPGICLPAYLFHLFLCLLL